MSVIVSDMKMPKNCEECPLGEWEDAKYFHCCLMEWSYAKTKGEILDNCPLVEVSDEDSISRKDVIKILEDGWKRGIYPSTGKIMALHSVNPKPRWIPCKERLPEKKGWYLVTWDGNLWGRDGERFVSTELWTGEQWDEATVYAWMPLPEIYRE